MSTFKILDRVVCPFYSKILTVISIEDGGENLILSDGEKVIYRPASELTFVGESLPREASEILRMYVLIDNTCPKGLAANGGMHVSYMAGRDFPGTVLQNTWDRTSFRNVSCGVAPDLIQEAIREADKHGIRHIEFYEPDWIGFEHVPLAVAFEARYWFPDIFKTFDFFLKGIR